MTCIDISQEADQVVWYFHLLKNFPQFIVIHTVKGFGIANKAEIDVFLNRRYPGGEAGGRTRAGAGRGDYPLQYSWFSVVA